MAGLGYVSLRHWQASAELLFREQARDMAVMAADKIEMTLREAEDALLDRLQAALVSGDSMSVALAEFSASHPLVNRLHVFNRQGELLYPANRHEGDAAIFARLLAEVSQGFWERGGRRELTGGDQIALAAILRGSDGGPVLATLTWNIDVLCEAILARTFRALEAPTILAVLDERERPLYSKEPLGGADRVLVVPFRERLATWRLAVYQAPGLSPRQAVRRQVMLFTAAFGVLLAIIVVGIVTTWRLMRREAEMAQLKSDFVANVSHDLKTPLSVIRMFGETLEMGRVTEANKRQEYYRVIARESERLSRLIENVLDFARIEGGRRTYVIVPTQVEPLIRDTLDAFEHPLASEGFKVEALVPGDLPEVPLDGEAIAQALANLIDNAIKYSGDHKALTVEARVVGDELALAVADTGVGIPREEQSKIFEKFYRAGRSETQGRRGSGVGLTLVRHIAEAHGGHVTVESTLGVGSRFTVWLPVHRGRRR
ncbi:MAG: sensor histidine kinase [Candidatus Rokuibacteriota bacterium]